MWGDTEDNNLGLLDAHDHGPGRGSRIKTAGISIDADLSFSSLYAPTALNRITFSSIAALSSNNKSLFVSNADNELYWRSNAGANVKLTSGSSLNVSAFTGGIGGDYTAVSASVQYDDANDRYTFKQQGGVWARMASGEVRILETGTSETVYVGQAAPAALAASYTMTWPTANPASTSIAQIDSTGQWSFTNTIVNDVTLAANKSVIVSGTGLYKHGDVTRTISATVGTNVTAGGVTSPVGSTVVYRTGASAGTFTVPFPVVVGKRLRTLTFSCKALAGGAIATAQLVRQTSEAVTTIGATWASGGSTSFADFTSATLNHTVVAGGVYQINFTFSGTVANTDFERIDIVEDQP